MLDLDLEKILNIDETVDNIEELIAKASVAEIQNIMNKYKFPVRAVVHRLIELKASLLICNRWEKNLLHFAAQEGDCEMIKYLMELRIFNVNGLCKCFLLAKGSKSPLMFACEKGHLDAVKWLVHFGADVNWHKPGGTPPIFFAIESGNLEVFEYLLQCGANVRAVDGDRRTCLSEAARSNNLPVLDRLIFLGLDPFVISSRGRNLLHEAAIQPKFEMLKRLLELRVNPNIPETMARERPIDGVVAKGDRAMLDLMMRFGADIINPAPNGKSAIHTAVSNENLEITQFLLEQRVDPNCVNFKKNGWTPIDYAIHVKSVPLIDLLLRYHANPFINNGLKENVLIRAVDTDDFEIFKRILAMGPNVTEVSSYSGLTALHKACSIGNIEMVKALLNLRVDPNCQDGENMSPLHTAAYNRHPQVVDLLIKRGADVNLPGPNKKLPLDMAMDNESRQILIKNGARNITAMEEFKNRFSCCCC